MDKPHTPPENCFPGGPYRTPGKVPKKKEDEYFVIHWAHPNGTMGRDTFRRTDQYYKMTRCENGALTIQNKDNFWITAYNKDCWIKAEFLTEEECQNLYGKEFHGK